MKVTSDQLYINTVAIMLKVPTFQNQSDQPVETWMCHIVPRHAESVVFVDVFIGIRRMRRAQTSKTVSEKYLATTSGQQSIKVKFSYADRINSSSQSYWLTHQLKNQRFNRSIRQGSQKPTVAKMNAFH